MMSKTTSITFSTKKDAKILNELGCVGNLVLQRRNIVIEHEEKINIGKIKLKHFLMHIFQNQIMEKNISNFLSLHL